MAEPILVERSGPIVKIVLNRPDKLNAMNKPMWLALGAAIAPLSEDPSVRCIVVRGAGEKAFCAGADISEFHSERSNSTQAAHYGRAIERVAASFVDCPHPLVAQIHGVCVGGGLLIACLCDIRICGESSRFGIPVKNLGLVEAFAEMSPLVDLVGRAVALEILLEGRVFGAIEAKEKGLVSRVVRDDQVASEADATAERIAEGAPLVARWHKKFARRLADPKPVSKEENLECFECFDTEDFRIGREAFLAKRKPVFTGR